LAAAAERVVRWTFSFSKRTLSRIPNRRYFTSYRVGVWPAGQPSALRAAKTPYTHGVCNFALEAGFARYIAYR